MWSKGNQPVAYLFRPYREEWKVFFPTCSLSAGITVYPSNTIPGKTKPICAVSAVLQILKRRTAFLVTYPSGIKFLCMAPVLNTSESYFSGNEALRLYISKSDLLFVCLR